MRSWWSGLRVVISCVAGGCWLVRAHGAGCVLFFYEKWAGGVCGKGVVSVIIVGCENFVKNCADEAQMRSDV